MNLPKLQFEAPVEPVVDRLQLADWRRRVAELYAAVRAEGDPERAHARWRETREWLYREHAASPVAPADRAGFRAKHFAYDPSLRFEATFQPESAGQASASQELPNSVGRSRQFDRIGSVEIPLSDGSHRLALFWLPEYSGGLFLAFRDATNGRETYGGGRYLLDTAKGADLGGDPAEQTLVVDFNFAFQPSCAFDPRWSCPLAAPENRLDSAIRAGERIA